MVSEVVEYTKLSHWCPYLNCHHCWKLAPHHMWAVTEADSGCWTQFWLSSALNCTHVISVHFALFLSKTQLYWRYVPQSTQSISLHLKESSRLNTQVEPALTSRIRCRFILLFISAIYRYSIWCTSLMHGGCTCKTSQDLDLAKHWWRPSKETTN